MLDILKVKAFDLEPIYESWPDAPHFNCNPKKDLPINDWLKVIKAGCVARKVPKEYWHKVAQHYMGDTPRARLDALKKVVENMTGAKYRWNWHKFKTAMRNMGWDVDSAATETVKVKAKPGVWWIAGRGESKSESKPPLVHRQSSMKSISSTSSKSSHKAVASTSKAVTTSNFHSNCPPHFDEAAILTTVAKAPTWLLNATQALEYLTSEHPKVMTAMSAILITVGSIPAIPAIAAGAGGAVLGSSAAHAVGAVAVGLGSWLKSQTDSSLAAANRPSPARAHTL